MKKILCSLFFMASLVGKAQKTIDVDKNDRLTYSMFFSIGGEPYVNTKFTRLVSGSPYFTDQWLKGSSIKSETSTYKAGLLKLDLLEDHVHYLDAAGQEMITTVPLKELTLTDSLTGNSYHFVHSTSFPQGIAPKKGWYLQRSDGKTSLYQFFSKQMMENKPYGSATAEQTIYTRNEFYLYHQGNFQLIKKPKDISSILTDKRKELDEFYKKNENQKASDEDRMTALVNYYTTLQ